jgi:hypothetical protein
MHGEVICWCARRSGQQTEDTSTCNGVLVGQAYSSAVARVKQASNGKKHERHPQIRGEHRGAGAAEVEAGRDVAVLLNHPCFHLLQHWRLQQGRCRAFVMTQGLATATPCHLGTGWQRPKSQPGLLTTPVGGAFLGLMYVKNLHIYQLCKSLTQRELLLDHEAD